MYIIDTETKDSLNNTILKETYIAEDLIEWRDFYDKKVSALEQDFVVLNSYETPEKVFKISCTNEYDKGK